MGKKEDARHHWQAVPSVVASGIRSAPKVRLQQLRTMLANAPYVCESDRDKDTAVAEIRAIWIFLKERSTCIKYPHQDEAK
jgi:hypothetical protein